MESENKSKLIIQISHLSIIFILILASLLNLSLGLGEKNLWISILTGAIGCVIPTPEFLFKKFEKAT